MPEEEGYNWGETLGTIATIATGNPYIGVAVNSGYNWVHSDKGTNNNNNNGSYNTGKLANNVVTAYAARRSSKKRAQATQNAGKLDLGYLRAEAEKNGFNPLTVLRATGGQGSRTSPDVGKMASAQFWQTFAEGLPDAYETTYDKRMKQAQLQNTLGQNTLGQNKQRSHFDIPLMINVFDESGSVEDFKIINPELIEMSGQEIRGSLAMLAGQYAAQHKISISKATRIIKNMVDNRRNNLGLEPVFNTAPILEKGVGDDWKPNLMPSFVDRVKQNYQQKGMTLDFRHMAN